MLIDEIREKIATALDMPSYEKWFTILDNTTPNHYGVEDLDFILNKNDIFADVPKRTFTFKNGNLSFSARLGGSSDADGFDKDIKKKLSGEGKFEFGENNTIHIVEFSINEEIDLME